MRAPAVFTCIVLDDQPQANELLQSFILKTPNLQLVGAYAHPLPALEVLLKNPVDFLFLDINMEGMNGLQVAMQLRHTKVAIVYTTAYPEFALPAIKTHPADYLLKPIGYTDFTHAVTNAIQWKLGKAANTGATPQPNFLTVKTNDGAKQIELSQIIYLQVNHNYITIHTRQGRELMRGTLKEMAELFPPKSFIQVHKSYIVAVRHCTGIQKNTVLLSGGHRLPVSRSNLKLLQVRLQMSEYVSD